MFKKNEGFTLIETLVVTAIVGILAALLLPQFISSIQKAKQKGTMQDMNGIAKAIVDYITDMGYAPTQSGPLTSGSDFSTEIRPFYSKALPLVDQWGANFYIYCGTALSAAGIDGVTASGSDEFLIISYGRDRAPTPFSFDPLTPTASFFETTSMAGFNQDLIIWNGSWIHAPKSAQHGR